MKLPPLTEKQKQDLAAEVSRKLAESRQDAEDKRTLRGKYAPAPGTCRVCGGDVVAAIGFPPTTRIGGPPGQGFVKGWHCEECGLSYGKRPPSTSMDSRTVAAVNMLRLLDEPHRASVLRRFCSSCLGEQDPARGHVCQCSNAGGG